ncbi:hypothetical protein MXY47_005074, partial [Salmonella enterica]|nr:hypothetical protein [Salmonella enterica]EKQ0641210.1 hypothetical protein [Salmonella enterica]
EPTDEMIAAAMNCEDVLFNSDESFCVQFGNIYAAMLAAAPQQEVKSALEHGMQRYAGAMQKLADSE